MVGISGSTSHKLSIPSLDLNQQAPDRIIDEILMPPNVYRIAHSRHDCNARRTKLISVAPRYIAGERSDVARSRGQVSVPAGTQSSLHLSCKRPHAVRALEREGEVLVVSSPPPTHRLSGM